MNQNNSTAKIVQRLFNEYIKKHTFKLIISVFCMTLVAAATAINAWMMQPVLDDIFINKNQKLIIIIPLAVLIVAIIKGIASYYQSILMSFVGYRMVSELQLNMLKSLLKCDMSYFSKTNSGTLVSRFLADVGSLSRGVHNVIINIVKDSLTFIFLVGVMFFHDFKLALVAIFVFPLIIYPISRIGRRLRKISKNTQVGFGTFTKKLTESFQAIKTIKSFNAEKIEEYRIGVEINNLFNLTFKSSRVNSISRPLMETIGGIAIAAIIFIGGSQVISGSTTPGTFFSFLTALLMAYQPIKSLASLNATLQMAMASAERVFDIIDTKPLIIENLKNKDHHLVLNKSYDLFFSNVSFKYDGSKLRNLKNINLEILKGEKVALVGYSGAGKTTLLNLLPRFYEIQKGRITIGNIDIRDLSLDFFYSLLFVSQDIVLFDETLKYNMTYGMKDVGKKKFAMPVRKLTQRIH